MKYRADITHINGHIDEFVKTVMESTWVRETSSTYGEFEDADTAERVEQINNILKDWET